MSALHDQLRSEKRKARAALDESTLKTAAQNLFNNLLQLQEYQDSQYLAAYWAVNGEIGLEPLIEDAWKRDKHVYLPILDEIDLRFCPYEKDCPMRINRFRLPEPDVSEEAFIKPKQLDTVLVPLTVFDANRNRIGMGGGYYDRSFEFRRTGGETSPILIGVAHELQRVEELIPEEWDVQLDIIVSDKQVYRP